MIKNRIKILLSLTALIVLMPIITFAEGQSGSGSGTTLDNPLPVTDPKLLIGQVINTALGLVGSIALLMFIYGGFVWMFSMGNTSKVQKGKDILIWSTAGLVVIFSAYALVKFVLKNVLGLT